MKNYFVKSKVLSTVEDQRKEENELLYHALVGGGFNATVRKEIQNVRQNLEWNLKILKSI